MKIALYFRVVMIFLMLFSRNYILNDNLQRGITYFVFWFTIFCFINSNTILYREKSGIDIDKYCIYI